MKGIGREKASWGKKAGWMLAAAVLAAGTVWGAAGSTPQVHAAAAADFTDVKPTHWAKSSIEAGVAKGYVDGYTNGTFKPDASVSRAEFVKMVVAAMKLEVKETSGKWYVPYVDAASAKGWYAAGDFANNEAAWNKTMTREEMARVAARAIGGTSKEDDKWMYLATKAGLIQGVGKGQLAPQGLTTRAQSVVIIERILTANAGGKLESDRYATGAAEILWHGTNIFTVMPEVWVTPESHLKVEGKESVEEFWEEKKMTVTSNDGLYQAKLDALIAIDLADPNDPNRGLLGDVNKLKWFNNDPTRKDLMVKDQKNSYILYFKGGVVFNKKPNWYNNKLTYTMSGITSSDLGAFLDKGVLNKVASVYLKRDGDLPMMIVPKTGWKQLNDLTIDLIVPGTSNSTYRNIELLNLRGTQ